MQLIIISIMAGIFFIIGIIESILLQKQSTKQSDLAASNLMMRQYIYTMKNVPRKDQFDLMRFTQLFTGKEKRLTNSEHTTHGWHFCNSLNGKLVHRSMPDYENCNCGYKQKNYYKGK